MYLKYLRSLLLHKWFVFLAGLKTGVPVWRLVIHDWSKFSPTEFIRYSKWLFGDVKDKKMWATAWHHHQRHNPHHPEFWILAWHGNPKFYDGVGHSLANFVTALPMPETYVREMVADWMGASRAYTGAWNMSKWLSNNGPNIEKNMHPETVRLVHSVLIEQGYFFTDNAPWICALATNVTGVK